MFDLKPTIMFDGNHPWLLTSTALFFFATSFFLLKYFVIGKLNIGKLFKSQPSKQDPESQETFSRRDITDIVLKVTEIVTKITEIKIRNTLFEQMMFAEQKLVIFQDLMLHKYTSLLNKKMKKGGAGDITGHEDYLFFNNVLALTLNNTKSNIREILQHAHFEEFSDEGYRQYIKERAVIILAQSVQFIWSMYPASKMEVTFFELDEMIRNEHDVFRDIIIDIFAESIKIHRIKRTEIDGLKLELDRYLNSKVKND